MLEGSGWTHLISSSTIISPGKANAMLNASSNIVLCRYIHQVTACALFIKKEKHTINLLVALRILCCLTSQDGRNCQRNIILHVELLLLEFIKSIRVGDFNLYIQTMTLIAPWMFSLDHHNYARWLPLHIMK